jgi:hypothetical protein
LYRLLRPDENPYYGLSAKNPYANISVEDHVGYGSAGLESQYISCCKSQSAMHRFSANTYTYPKRVVEIRISDAYVIDLTDPETLDKCIPPWNARARNFATKFEEVLLVGFIPSYYITCAFYL